MVVAPVLVIDRYPNPDPPQQDGDKINEEVYCLTTIPNDGASNLCAVGYFCQWDPNNRATHAFSLMRQYLGSGSPTVTGLFERFQRANAQHPSVPTLTFLEVYGRTATTLTDAPLPSMTEMASYIWDLQIRTHSQRPARRHRSAVVPSAAHLHDDRVRQCLAGLSGNPLQSPE